MIFEYIGMNQELFVKLARWVLYASIGTLIVAIFFTFFARENGRGAMYRQDAGLKSNVGNEVPLWQSMERMMGEGDGYSSGIDGSSVGMDMSDLAPTEKMMGEAAPSPIVATGEMDTFGMMSAEGMERRVVRNGNLSIRVEDAEWSADEIDRIATRLGGFTASRTLSGEIPDHPMPMMRNESYGEKARVIAPDTVRSGLIIIKVPSSKFDEANAAIKGISTVVMNESSTASDVSAQFADLEAQIKNKYAEEAAFIRILDTNTGKITDILAVTRELSRVRGEIERLEAQKKYMESQTDMAEISISLSEDVRVGAVTDTWRPWQTVKDALNRLVGQFRGLVDGIIYFVVTVLPFFLLYLLGLFVLYRIGRRLYEKMKSRN